jgi:hypothetical protein
MSVSSEAVAGRLRVKTDAIDLEAICRRRHKHDLRHTAACLWLAKGVDPVTVQAWLGHASIATTNIYLHHLGSSADPAGLERLNALGAWGGANDEGRGMTTLVCSWCCRVFAARRGVFVSEPPVGIEPTTFSLRETTKCSPRHLARPRCNACKASNHLACIPGYARGKRMKLNHAV